MKAGELELRHRSSGLPRKVHVVEPTLLLYPRPEFHEFRNPPIEGSEFTCAEIEFEGGDLHPLVRSLPPLLLLPLSQVRGLELSLQLLFAETEQLLCGRRVLADRLFEVVLIQLLRWLVDNPSEGGVRRGLISGLADTKIAKALASMHDQPGRNWALEDLAHVAGMSRSTFASRFKTTVGQGPAAYLADWRITLAQQQLKLGKSLKQLADELGYANASALSRVFSQRVGLSPREWRLARTAADADGKP